MNRQQNCVTGSNRRILWELLPIWDRNPSLTRNWLHFWCEISKFVSLANFHPSAAFQTTDREIDAAFFADFRRDYRGENRKRQKWDKECQMVIPLLRQMTAILWPFRFSLPVQNYFERHVSKSHVKKIIIDCKIFCDCLYGKWLKHLSAMRQIIWESLSGGRHDVNVDSKSYVTRSRKAYLRSQIHYARNTIGWGARSGRTIKLRSFVVTEELPSDIHCLISVSENAAPNSWFAGGRPTRKSWGVILGGEDRWRDCHVCPSIIIRAGHHKIETLCFRSLLIWMSKWHFGNMITSLVENIDMPLFRSDYELLRLSDIAN